MEFKSFADFIAMGGYGFFVWLSFGFCLVVYAGITVMTLRKQKQLKAEVLQTMDREQRMKQAREQESDLL